MGRGSADRCFRGSRGFHPLSEHIKKLLAANAACRHGRRQRGGVCLIAEPCPSQRVTCAWWGRYTGPGLLNRRIGVLRNDIHGVHYGSHRRARAGGGPCGTRASWFESGVGWRIGLRGRPTETHVGKMGKACGLRQPSGHASRDMGTVFAVNGPTPFAETHQA